jgi:prolyl oligopeptidase
MIRQPILARIIGLYLVAALAPVIARAAAPAPTTALPTPARWEVVVDSAFGLRLEDPYQWMERPNDPEFRTWLQAQGDYARHRLDAIPGRSRMARRLKSLSFETAASNSVQRRGSSLFYMRIDKGGSLAKLVVRRGDGTVRVLLDPARRRGADSSHVSIDNYSVSWDGRLVACNLAEGGSEVTQVHVLDTETGSETPDVIEHIWGQFPVTWLPDGSGFFYTQMAEAGFRDPSVDRIQGMRVRRHLLGSRAEDDPVILGPDSVSSFKVEPREFPGIDVPRESRYAIAYCAGAHPECRIYVAPLDQVRPGMTPWRRVCEYEDQIATFDSDSSHLYLLSHHDAPNRRLLRVSLSDPNLAQAEEIIPQGERILSNMVMARDGLYTLESDAGVDRIFRLRPGRARPEEIPLPIAGAVRDLAGDVSEEGIIFSLAGWTQPETYYQFLPGAGRLKPLGLGAQSSVDFSSVIAERVEVRSFDGTMVPLTILRAKSLQFDRGHPTILNGYGAYGASIRPAFSASRLAWLERGGVLAYAHTRGGGEKGDAWHEAGKGANKPNAVGDFIACAEYMVSKGYTSPERLAAMGSSGGGLLVGGAVVRRPDLFDAAVLVNAVLNPVRFLHGTNGANQIPEMGSPDTEAGLRALVAMDPTLAIREGTQYPAVLVSVGLHDNRVSPWQSGKFAARLMATKTKAPVWIRVEPESGHGVGSTREQAAELSADIYSFLWWRLGERAPAASGGRPASP